MARIVSYLGLSQEQIAKMRELRSRFRNETHDLRYDLAMKRLEMRELFNDPKSMMRRFWRSRRR